MPEKPNELYTADHVPGRFIHPVNQSTPPLPWLLDRFTANPAAFTVLIFIFLMIYQAILPAGLTLDPAARDVSWEIFSTDTFHISISNIVGNIVPYFIFGHFVFVATWHRRHDANRVLLVTFAGTVAMSVTVEVVQLFNLYRTTDIWDVLCGIIGGIMALVSGTFYVKVVSDRLGDWLKIEFRRNPLIVAAAFLAIVIVWDAARPFYIISSADKFFENIKHSNLIPFEPPGRDIREQIGLRPSISGDLPRYTPDYLGSLAERFMVYGVLYGLLSAAWRKFGIMKALKFYFAFILSVELVNLGVVHGRVDITRLVTGIVAIPAAIYFADRYSKYHEKALRFFMVVFGLYILISDLRPYSFGPMSDLNIENFIPLISHVRSADVMLLANIVEAVAVYSPLGMLYYLIPLKPGFIISKKNWPSSLPTCLLCAGIALVIEIVQLWIPERTSGIEDVVYALLGGYAGVSAARLYFYLTLTSSFRFNSKKDWST